MHISINIFIYIETQVPHRGISLSDSIPNPPTAVPTAQGTGPQSHTAEWTDVVHPEHRRPAVKGR